MLMVNNLNFFPIPLRMKEVNAAKLNILTQISKDAGIRGGEGAFK